MKKHLLLSAIVTVVTCFNCPDGIAGTKCNPTACPTDKKCYVDADGVGNCCSPKFCNDTNLESYVRIDATTYKFKKDGDLVGQRVNRNMEQIEVSCPVPISSLFQLFYTTDTTNAINGISEVEKYPFDKNGNQWKPDGSVAITPCVTNNDCTNLTKSGETVGYCYKSRNPSLDDIGFRDAITFCYKLKELKDSNFHIDPAVVGPKFCSLNSDCASKNLQGSEYDAWYCHKVPSKYLDTTGAVKNGICVRTRACLGDSFAMRPQTGDNCSPASIDSCKFTGSGTQPWVRSPDEYISSCINVSLTTETNFLCCQIKNLCSIGKTSHPLTSCSNATDCNKKTMDPNNFDTYKSWCDPVQQKCCEPDTDKNVVYCPDGATPLGFEKECGGGYIKGEDSTGSCSNDHLDKGVTTSGVCYHGHCCAQTRVENNQTVMGGYSFSTNHPCIDGELPDRYKFAYCDSKTDKVVVIGSLSLKGVPMVKGSTECTSNGDCEDDDVCVAEEDDTKYCYEISTKKSESWMDNLMPLLIGVGIAAGVAIAITIVWCTCLPKRIKKKVTKVFCFCKKKKEKSKRSTTAAVVEDEQDELAL